MTKTLRVLFVTKGVPWQTGAGGEFVFVFELADHLARRGHRVTVLAATQPEFQRQVEGYRVWYAKPVGRKMLPFSLYLAARRHFRDFDLVHVSGGEGALFSLRSKCGFKLPVVASQNINPRARSLLTTSFWRRCERWATVWADAVTVPSQFTAGETARVYRIPSERIHVIPAGLRVLAEQPVRAREATSELRLLSIGRLGEGKGTDVMLKALSLIPKETGLRLKLVGDGDFERYRAMARELGVESAVDFSGPVSYDEIVNSYAQADIYLSATRAETFGIAIGEAMAMGLPVVASATGAVPELVSDGSTGLLAPVGDADAFAKAILRLAQDPKLRQSIGTAAAREARSRFRWEYTAELTEKVYHAVLQRRQIRSKF